MRLSHTALQLFALGGISMLLMSQPCRGSSDYGTPAEQELLPEWCRNYQIIKREEDWSPVAKAQIAKFRKSGCGGFHHYTWALIDANKAFFGDYPTEKKHFYFSEAIDNFRYVFKNSKPSCVLIPDMHAKSGDYYALMGKPKEAVESYQQALKANPGYTPAFIGLSDLYEMQGDTEKAVSILQAGVKANPRSNPLKKKLSRLQARISGGPDQPGSPANSEAGANPAESGELR